MKITDVTLTLFSWEKHRFAVNSPLERRRFEPSVPLDRAISSRLRPSGGFEGPPDIEIP